MSDPCVGPATARLQLDVAVAQLVQPSTEKIARADGLLDDQVAAQRADQRAVDAELSSRHARYLRAGHHAQARRTLEQLSDHRRRVTAGRGSEAVTTAVVPCLLVQLRSEIGASSNTGAGGSAGPYRSPIALPATQLYAEIQRQTRAPVGALDLRPHVSRWAIDPHDLTDAAARAETWVEQIRTLLNPPKRWSHPGACPDCGHTTAHVLDPSGDTVRKPAIEFDRQHGRARCLRCPARWTTEAQLHNLARVLDQQHEQARTS